MFYLIFRFSIFEQKQKFIWNFVQIVAATNPHLNLNSINIPTKRYFFCTDAGVEW